MSKYVKDTAASLNQGTARIFETLFHAFNIILSSVTCDTCL